MLNPCLSLEILDCIIDILHGANSFPPEIWTIFPMGFERSPSTESQEWNYILMHSYTITVVPSTPEDPRLY